VYVTSFTGHPGHSRWGGGGGGHYKTEFTVRTQRVLGYNLREGLFLAGIY